MKKKLKKIVQHPLISGSSIIFSGTLLGNIFNFLFTVYMIAHLSGADYGVLVTIISLISIPSLAASAIVPAVVKFAGTYYAKEEHEKARDLYAKVGKMYLVMGLAFFILFLIFIPQLSAFFKIKTEFLLVIADLTILLSIFYALNNAFLQAKLSFVYLSVLVIIGAALKFFSGITFTNYGLAVTGAVIALFLSFFVPFLVSFFPLRSLLQTRVVETKTDVKELFKYGFPSAITVLGMTSFITADILLIKHFFNSTDAGYYASISTIARVIFYFTAPIGTVMFPLVVQKISKKENYSNIFFLSLFLVLVPSLMLTGMYFLMPDFVLRVFNVKNVTDYDLSLIGYFGIFISLYAVLSILTNFYLSIKRTKVAIPVVVGAVAQICVIWLVHNDFYTVIMISIVITFLLLLSLLIYYPYATKEQ